MCTLQNSEDLHNASPGSTLTVKTTRYVTVIYDIMPQKEWVQHTTNLWKQKLFVNAGVNGL